MMDGWMCIRGVKAWAGIEVVERLRWRCLLGGVFFGCT